MSGSQSGTDALKAGRNAGKLPPALGLVLGVLAVSTASTFIRLAQDDVPSLAVAAWRLTFASLLLAPLAFAMCRREWRLLDGRAWALLALSGAVLAVHFHTWIVSLAMTSVAASVVLVSTNPLFVAIISHTVLGETLTRRMTAGLLVAVTGSAIIGFGDLDAGTHMLLGDLLALIGAVAVAIYLLIGRRLRARLSLLGYIFPVYGIAALVLMVLAVVSGVQLSGYPVQAWLWLALVALIPQIVGHSSFNWALRHLPATYVSLAVLAEPIGSTLLAWAFLKESPTLVTTLGGVLILIGIGLAVRNPNTGESS